MDENSIKNKINILIMKITNEMREALRKPLPKEAVKPHPTKSYLSSIKAVYVTERLNEVFGTGSWQLRVVPVTVTDKGMVVVKVEFTIPEYGVFYECFGGNDNGGEGSKNFDLGDAYKGATTDAITKIGSYLEIGIDVFKGATRVRLSDSQYSQLLGRVKDGDREALVKANLAFIITDDQLSELIKNLK